MGNIVSMMTPAQKQRWQHLQQERDLIEGAKPLPMPPAQGDWLSRREVPTQPGLADGDSLSWRLTK